MGSKYKGKARKGGVESKGLIYTESLILVLPF